MVDLGVLDSHSFTKCDKRTNCDAGYLLMNIFVESRADYRVIYRRRHVRGA